VHAAYIQDLTIFIVFTIIHTASGHLQIPFHVACESAWLLFVHIYEKETKELELHKSPWLIKWLFHHGSIMAGEVVGKELLAFICILIVIGLDNFLGY